MAYGGRIERIKPAQMHEHFLKEANDFVSGIKNVRFWHSDLKSLRGLAKDLKAKGIAVEISVGATWPDAINAAMEAEIRAGINPRSEDAAGNAALHAAKTAEYSASRSAVGKRLRESASAKSFDYVAGAIMGDRRWAGINPMNSTTLASWAALENVPYYAELMVSLLVVKDLNFPGKANHIAFAEACWGIFKTGNGVLCDNNGIIRAFALSDSGKSSIRNMRSFDSLQEEAIKSMEDLLKALSRKA